MGVGQTRSMARYDATTALVVVDMQNDFAHPEGSLSVEGGADVVGAVNREIAAAREAGAPVVFSRDWHPPDTRTSRRTGASGPSTASGHLGAEFVDGLDLGDWSAGPSREQGTGGEDGYSVFSVRDPRSGATADTSSSSCSGLAGSRGSCWSAGHDYCVKETVLDARRRGFGAVVVGDGVRPVDRDPGDGERALDEMIRAGATLS